MSWLTSIGDVVGAAFGFPGAGSAVGALFGDSSSFAAPALSGALDFFGQSSANNVNKDIAALNNSTALDLANTAHQREVKDLIAAGLNPMLSAKLGGAQVPQLQQARVENAAGRGVSSAMAAREMQARITNLEEQNNKLITAQSADIANANNADNLSQLYKAQTIGAKFDNVLKSIDAGIYGSTAGELIRGSKILKDVLPNLGKSKPIILKPLLR